MKKKVSRVENLSIPILTGSFFDLQQFDFSFIDIIIMDIQSKAFKQYLKKYQPFAEDQYPLIFINNLEQKVSVSFEKYYAIVKSNPNEKYNEIDFYTVFKILLVIYPSDLQMEHLIEYHGANNGPTLSSWNKRYTGKYPGSPLFAKGTPSEVNEFLPLIFKRINQHKYITFIIGNYVASFDTPQTKFQFINLCICLESVIDGSDELNYRLRRCIAILCGENDLASNLIFKNLREIYNLRSKIVHGANYDIQKMEEYLPFLKAIVSRIIIELLIHNISTPLLLNEIITKIGFGEREKISKNWKNYTLNLITFSESNYTELK